MLIKLFYITGKRQMKCKGTLIVANYEEKGKEKKQIGAKVVFTQDKKKIKKIKSKWKKELKKEIQQKN